MVVSRNVFEYIADGDRVGSWQKSEIPEDDHRAALKFGDECAAEYLNSAPESVAAQACTCHSAVAPELAASFGLSI